MDTEQDENEGGVTSHGGLRALKRMNGAKGMWEHKESGCKQKPASGWGEGCYGQGRDSRRIRSGNGWSMTKLNA